MIFLLYCIVVINGSAFGHSKTQYFFLNSQCYFCLIKKPLPEGDFQWSVKNHENRIIPLYYAFIHNGLAHLMFSENQSSLIIVEVIDKDSMIYKAKGGFYEEGILSYGAL